MSPERINDIINHLSLLVDDMDWFFYNLNDVGVESRVWSDLRFSKFLNRILRVYNRLMSNYYEVKF